MGDRGSKQLIAHYFEGFWKGHREGVADEVLAPDVILHGLLDEIRAGTLPPGPAAEKVVLRRITTAFPDVLVEVEDILEEDDLVAVRWHATGTHLGDFNGIPPTGRRVVLRAMAFSRVVGGPMVEGWMELDRAGLARGLGLLPPEGLLPRPLAASVSLLARARDRRWQLPTAQRPARGEGKPPAGDLVRLVEQHLEAWWSGGEPLGLGTAFPDPAIELHGLVSEGDRVAARWSATATHLGRFRGFPATGRRVTTPAMSFLQLADGEVVGSTGLLDELGIAEQLGLLSAKGMPRPLTRAMVSLVRLRDRRSQRAP